MWMYTGVVEVHKPTKRRKPHVFSLIFLMVFLSFCTIGLTAVLYWGAVSLLFIVLTTNPSPSLNNIWVYTDYCCVLLCMPPVPAPFPHSPPPSPPYPRSHPSTLDLAPVLAPFSGDTPCWYFFCQHLCLLFSAPMLYPAMFTCKRLWRVVHWLMFCLFPSLFFLSHTPFLKILFLYFAVLTPLLHVATCCCHFMKSE